MLGLQSWRKFRPILSFQNIVAIINECWLSVLCAIGRVRRATSRHQNWFYRELAREDLARQELNEVAEFDFYFQDPLESSDFEHQPLIAPLYDDVVSLPLYESYELVLYDTVPITEADLNTVNCGAHVHVKLPHPLVSVDVRDPEYDVFFPDFFNITEEDDIVEATLPLPQDSPKPVGTAFPILGEEFTCDCILAQDTTLAKGSITAVLKTFVLGSRGSDLLQPFFTSDSIKGWLIPSNADTIRVAFLQREFKTICGYHHWDVVTFNSCHLSKGQSLETGHDLKVIAHASVANSSVDECSRTDHYHPHKRLRQMDLDKGTACGCWDATPRKIPNRDTPKGYISLATRLSKAKESLKTLPEPNKLFQLSQAQKLLSSELACRVSEYNAQIGSKLVSPQWYVATEAALDFGVTPVTITDARPVFVRDIPCTTSEKRAYKRLCSHLARVARDFGAKIAADKSFDTSTYQEWLEMETRRYEDAYELSRSQKVRGCSQAAQAWLKTSSAKHWLSSIKRRLVYDEIGAISEYCRFNRQFIFQGGVSLPIPESWCNNAAKTRERLESLRQKQLDGREQAKQRDQALISKMGEKFAKKRGIKSAQHSDRLLNPLGEYGGRPDC